MTLKDWLTTSVAVLALFVAGTTLYYNLFRQYDDVRVVIVGMPIIQLKEDVAEFEISGPQFMTFINSGNRMVAIYSVELALLQPTPKEPDPKSCNTWDILLLPFDTSPFVLKPAEITPKILRLFKLRSHTDFPSLYRTKIKNVPTPITSSFVFGFNS